MLSAMNRRRALQLIASATALFATVWAPGDSAQAHPPPSGTIAQWVGHELVTTKNLHPDEARGRLYAVNYQQSGLIPLCTKVRIESYSHKRMVFRVLETGRPYTYYAHKSMREPFDTHLRRYFGVECPDVSGMSEIDQEGIRIGQVLVGMTREGVQLAIGLPPRHETPSLKSPQWKYWRSRADTFMVYFGADGKVSGLRD